MRIHYPPPFPPSPSYLVIKCVRKSPCSGLEGNLPRQSYWAGSWWWQPSQSTCSQWVGKSWASGWPILARRVRRRLLPRTGTSGSNGPGNSPTGTTRPLPCLLPQALRSPPLQCLKVFKTIIRWSLKPKVKSGKNFYAYCIITGKVTTVFTIPKVALTN